MLIIKFETWVHFGGRDRRINGTPKNKLKLSCLYRGGGVVAVYDSRLGRSWPDVTVWRSLLAIKMQASVKNCQVICETRLGNVWKRLNRLMQPAGRRYLYFCCEHCWQDPGLFELLGQIVFQNSILIRVSFNRR